MENLQNQQNTANQPNNQAYPPPLPPEVIEEKRFKKWMYRIFGANLLYDGIMLGIVIAIGVVIGIVLGVIMVINNSPDFLDEAVSQFEKTDMGSSIAVIIACFFLGLFLRKTVKFKEIFIKRKSMNVKSLFMIFSIFYGGQLVFTLFDMGLEFLLNRIGFTAQEAVEAASAGSESITMMIYAGFVAPVIEEIVFRGYMMKSLEKTGVGKGYAILVSSILFGVMHGNFVQSPFAFVVGMVLGYTAMEYGIVWSILIHFVNNFIMGDVFTRLIDRLPENIGGIVEYTVLAAFTIIAVIVLIINRRAVAANVKENYQTPKKYYKWTFTNPLFIIFCIIYFLMSFLTITRLE
ncbi:MAG: CPBP family intramembrane metalloprotease [Ruminococcus sp.]|nr:CPBP family intramembrane metalloprotease [Ruminococcus sp.]